MENHFLRLGLSKDLLEILSEKNFFNPTSIQNKSIPYILGGFDVVGTAATGSGKTLAYILPLLQKVVPGGGLQGIIIAPTRELVKQIGLVADEFNRKKQLNITTSYGGSSIKGQRQKIEQAEILILTSGRLIEFIKDDIIHFSNLKILVLDEADSLFQNQFLDEMDFILHNMPRKKQTILVSATIDKDLYLSKIRKWMKQPKLISAEKQVSPKKLKQQYYLIDSNQKLSLLNHLLSVERAGLSLVFVNRQDSAEFLSKNLDVKTLKINSIHGGLTQGKRNKIIKDFQNQKFDVLISTDMAARGLDIENITHIYNYNIPIHDEKYLHRIGRTARMGESGKVINFVSKTDELVFLQVMRKYKISMLKKELPLFEEVFLRKEVKKRNLRSRTKIV